MRERGAGAALACLIGLLGCGGERIVYLDLRPAREAAIAHADSSSLPALDCWADEPTAADPLRDGGVVVRGACGRVHDGAGGERAHQCRALEIRTVGDLTAAFRAPAALIAGVPVEGPSFLRLTGFPDADRLGSVVLCGVTAGLPRAIAGDPPSARMWIFCRPPELEGPGARLFAAVCASDNFAALLPP